MQTISLYNPFLSGFDPDKEQEKADAILAEYIKVYEAIGEGRVCIRYLDGDRKGSIARVHFSEKYKRHDKPAIVHRYAQWRAKNTKEFKNYYFRCTATWDGRRNKVQVIFPNHYVDAEILIDYEGPTVWNLFDAKAAKNEILKNLDQKDIDGNILSVGDKVLYINARYGSRMTLDRGTIDEFKVVANSSKHTITTIIKSVSGEISSLHHPENMVYRL